ncbi:uncharacterized protein [Nicotiana sylvestris]|uniref:uncharacterized protein n=1 Tax=Nicotiana sylvestris TaxID=4096 RepID=UPI00388CA4D2
MASPPNLEEGQSTYRPPKFNGQHYGWWKARMHDFIMAKDCELWDIICDGPYVPTKVLEELPFSMETTSKEYTEADKKAEEKNFRAKKILVYGIGPEVYNIISTCDTAKEIWEALQIAHEGTTQELTIEELIRNLKTYELKRKINSERREPKKEKNLVLKFDYNDSGEEDSDMAYLTKRFQKMVRRNREMLKRNSSDRPRNCDLCYRCGKPEYFMKDCPLLQQEFSKNHHERTAKTNSALAAWGDSSSESEDEPDTSDSSMMAVEGEKTGYDSTFALMAQSYDDEDNSYKEVNFRDVQRNLKSYSPKKLMSLANVLITAFHSLVEDRDSLILELGESEQTRDDLVVVVTDHKKTIEILRKEKSDLLAEIADLRETIVKPWTKSKPESSGKGKEIAIEEHNRLEK